MVTTAYIPDCATISNVKLPASTSECPKQAFTQSVVFLPQLLTKVMCSFFQHQMFAKRARKGREFMEVLIYLWGTLLDFTVG